MGNHHVAREPVMASSRQAQGRLERPAIVDTRRRIRAQIQLIRATRRDGGDTLLAVRALCSMLRSLTALRWNEDLLAAVGVAQREIPSSPDRPKPTRLGH